MSILLESLDHEVASITRDAERALVRIGNAGEGFGAGAIVQADGLIVTNAHVLRRDDVTVTLADGRTFRGTVLARDRQRDLAAVSIPVSGLPILPIGDSATMLRAMGPGAGAPLGRRGRRMRRRRHRTQRQPR